MAKVLIALARAKVGDDEERDPGAPSGPGTKSSGGLWAPRLPRARPGRDCDGRGRSVAVTLGLVKDAGGGVVGAVPWRRRLTELGTFA